MKKLLILTLLLAFVISSFGNSVNLKTTELNLPKLDYITTLAKIGKRLVAISDNGIWLEKGDKTFEELKLDNKLKNCVAIVDKNQLLIFGKNQSFKLNEAGQVTEFAGLGSTPLAIAMMNGYIYIGTSDALLKLKSDDLTKITKIDNVNNIDFTNNKTITIFDEILFFNGKNQKVFGYRERPVDGTTERGFRELASLPQAWESFALYQTGQNHVAIFGKDKVYVFHVPTESYHIDGNIVNILTDPFVIDNLLIDINQNQAYNITLNRVSKSLNWLDYAMILLYFVGIAWIGLFFAKKQTSSEEFVLGNRNVKWYASAISMFATGASSISFMAIPAQAFHSNLTWFFPVLLTIPMYFVTAYIIYPILIKMRITSVYEYLDRRYHPSLRYIASAQCILLEVLGRMSVVLLLPAIAISAVTGLDVFVSILIMGGLTTIYTALGGFEAVVWTDVIQGVLMLVGCLLMIVLAIWGLPGGMSEFIEVSQKYNKFRLAIWDFDYTVPILYIVVLGAFLNSISFGNQAMVQRVFATPLKDVRKFAMMFTFCAILIALLVNFCGISIFSYFKANPQQLDIAMTNDQVIPLYIIQRLPVGVAGLIIAALFAASMSTLSSSMNSVASLFLEDFYKKFRTTTNDKEYLMVLKLSSMLVGVIGIGGALYMAAMNMRSIFETWNVIVAILGGGFSGIYILGMFSRRTNAIGAIAGVIASIIVTIWMKECSNIHWLFFTPLSVIICMIAGYFTSILLPFGEKKNLKGLTAYDIDK